MGEEVQVTTEDQFYVFARLNDTKRSGETITLYRSDYWMRQAHVLDDRNVTMVNTGSVFFGKFSKTEINYKEWTEFVVDLCALKGLDEESTLTRLTNCGLPGDTTVVVPEFRTYFNTWESKSELYCNATYDGYLCWPPTRSGHVVTQNCPKEHFSDPSHLAVKKCGEDGKWSGKHLNDTNPNGWTNYTPCFPKVVQNLFNQLHDGDAQRKFAIADTTRTIEIAGFSISLISLLMSLLILHKYESLHSMKTSIHKNLFASMSFQVVVRLIVYVDQAMMRRGAGTSAYTGISAIENLPFTCICMYITLEFSISVMFMWMLCEGVYLNTIVTSNVLRDNTHTYKYYCIVGWLSPILYTTAWATTVGIQYSQEATSSGCWYGYNFSPFFWIIQGPRLIAILVNFFFLGNIMRVLVSKLRDDPTSDLKKTRKAVKAALFLLPLLGITNILSMFEGPVSGPVWLFATWCYITHFLRSFQGTFLAWLYCLTTAEVRLILKREFNNRLSIFRHRHPDLTNCLGIARRRPIQRYPRTFNTPIDQPAALMRHADHPARQLMHYRPLQRVTPVRETSRSSQTDVNSDLIYPMRPGDIPLRHLSCCRPEYTEEVPERVDMPRLGDFPNTQIRHSRPNPPVVARRNLEMASISEETERNDGMKPEDIPMVHLRDCMPKQTVVTVDPIETETNLTGGDNDMIHGDYPIIVERTKLKEPGEIPNRGTETDGEDIERKTKVRFNRDTETVLYPRAEGT